MASFFGIKMEKIKYLLINVFLFGSANAAETQVYGNFDIGLISEPVPISVIGKKGAAGGKSYKSGELQVATLYSEVGVKKGKWSVGVLGREYHQYSFNKDTSDFYYGWEHEQNIEAGRNYQLALEAKRFRAQGIRIARDVLDTNNLKVQLGASYLKATKLMDGDIWGNVTPKSGSSLGTYALNVDYQYDEDVLLDRTLDSKPNGEGVSIDAKLHWKPSSRTQLDIEGRDLLGHIVWKDAPYTTAQSSSQKTDSQGDRVPLISWREWWYSNYTQKLESDIKASFSVSDMANKKSAAINIHKLGDKSFAGVSAGLSHLNRHYKFAYYPELELVDLGFESGMFKVSVGADSLDSDKARSMWSSVSWNANF